MKTNKLERKWNSQSEKFNENKLIRCMYTLEKDLIGKKKQQNAFYSKTLEQPNFINLLV